MFQRQNTFADFLSPAQKLVPLFEQLFAPNWLPRAPRHSQQITKYSFPGTLNEVKYFSQETPKHVRVIQGLAEKAMSKQKSNSEAGTIELGDISSATLEDGQQTTLSLCQPLDTDPTWRCMTRSGPCRTITKTASHEQKTQHAKLVATALWSW